MWLWLLAEAHAAPVALVCGLDGDGPGKDCYSSLEGALEADETVIVLSPGLHYVSDLTLREKAVEIRALAPAEWTLVAPLPKGASDTVLTIDGGNVRLSGFSIDPAYDLDVPGPGNQKRALSVTGGAVVELDKLKVYRGYHSDEGGGMWVGGGSTVDIVGCEFGTNDAGGEGGHVYAENSTLNVVRSLFDTGSATSGGAIAAVDTRLSIETSVFTTLSAEEGGGVFAYQSPSVSVGESVFCGLGATYGAAVHLLESCSEECDLDNSIFQDNVVDQAGGGMWVDVPAGPVSVAQNTFFNNFAGTHGAAAEFFQPTRVSFLDNLIVQNVAQGAAVMASPLSAADIGRNAWFENSAYSLAGADGGRTPLPDGNLALENQPVWAAGLSDYSCGQLANLDWTDPANTVLFENTMGALTSDFDEDGVPASADCMDSEPTVYPGAREIPGDGLDNDCDGSESCFVDNDQDGVGGEVAVVEGDCFDAPYVPLGGDCDDTNDQIRACAQVAGGGGCAHPVMPPGSAMVVLWLLCCGAGARRQRTR